jgi:hypothetical protein
MGLDQYAFAAESLTAVKEQATRSEFAYWRKHNRLQGWMENLYKSKGGKDEFNCTPLELTEADLKTLEHDIKGQTLPSTQGFFFGPDSYGDYHSEHGYFKDDCKFLKDARKYLKEGKKVFYYCWW